MFCAKCGRMCGDDSGKCPYCGYDGKDSPVHRNDVYINYDSFAKSENGMPDYEAVSVGCAGEERKSRLTAGILQIFLGAFGVGRFYMGSVGVALGQIAATVVSCGIAGFIWGMVDGIMILNGQVGCDGKNIPLKD